MRLIKKAKVLDARTIVITEPEVQMKNENEKIKFFSFKISALLNNQEVGYLSYVSTEKKNEKELYIEFLNVDEEYRQIGIGQLLYKKFGEVYSKDYYGWDIGRQFANPVAEYSFRKAVGLGWIPEIAITENKIERMYDDEDKVLWNDLRNKLPEHVRGTGAKIKKDMRKLANSVTLSPIDIQQREISNRGRKIEIFRDGELLGDMKYEIYPEQNYVYINYVDVQEQHRKNGVAMLLYKTFSDIYNSKYQNWKIGRVFINPVAEYAFNKAVAQGWFPESTLNDGKRDYTPDEEEKWYNELEPKLRDLRKKETTSV